MPNEGETLVSNSNTAASFVETTPTVPESPAIGGNTPLTDGGVAAHTVLNALAEDHPQHAGTDHVIPDEGTQNKDAVELLRPREYPLLAQGIKARALQVLTQMKEKIPDNLPGNQMAQAAINAINAQESTHVGSRNGLRAFIDSLAASSEDGSIKNAIQAVVASANALTKGDQTAQNIALACHSLRLISPYSIPGVLNTIGNTFTQKAQEAVRNAALELRYQNRTLTPEHEQAIAAQVLAPYLTIIEDKHILTPSDLTNLMQLAEDAKVTAPKAVTMVQNNEQLQSLRAGIEGTVAQYGDYLNGTETNWDNSVPDVIADSVAQVLNAEDEIQQDVEYKAEVAASRKKKLKTTSMLVALILGMLIYSSMPKGEQV
ncbi:hypothetical protein COU88_03665 [Candidatus Roizmanbacteria bacterium CG10_big_fil_rev_8_21_14_0_10_39_6]|uniref:Uncharacterized protein n=1 Tax=Candidatus Roizmanbacteria bacterium CG10_big_fil_rev_8_21_14_0_10_39_6 TaxID=1974853 RepID=A0A2M8KRZ8_9BACT|nr:MAG: hypothetical protein COU88_03665 [Candidatus Roizmanbacteria bacterium CG10_big_fil_rev_8_21_14_0_10_39_6]